MQCRRRGGDRRLRREVERGIDPVLEPRSTETHTSLGEGQRGAHELEGAADHIETAVNARHVRGTRDLQIAAELGVEPATLNENRPRRVDLEIEPDHELLLRGRGWRLAGPSHVEDRDLGRHTARNADDSALRIDGAGEVDPLAQRPLQVEIGIQIRGEDVTRNRLGVAGGQVYVDGDLRLQHTDRACHRDLARWLPAQ